jgi:hypothetical protein
MLISEAETTQDLYLQGAKGYNNAITILDKASATLYGNTANAGKGITVRSLNFEDVAKAMGLMDETVPKATRENAGYANYTTTYSYTNQYLPENYASGTRTNFPATSSWENFNEDILREEYGLNPNSIAADLIFGGLQKRIYWLASHSVDARPSVAYFFMDVVNHGDVNGWDLFGSYGYENGVGLPVRAAVSLHANILSNETGDGTISNPYTLK